MAAEETVPLLHPGHNGNADALTERADTEKPENERPEKIELELDTKNLGLWDVFTVCASVLSRHGGSCLSSLTFQTSLSIFLSLIQKFMDVGQPLVYKAAVDSLAAVPPVGSSVLVELVVIWGVLGFGSGAVSDLRESLFMKVTQKVSATMRVDVFKHLHSLSVEYHVKRKTGEVLRAIDRGTTSMAALLEVLLFQIFPIIVEVVLTVAILLVNTDKWVAGVTFVGVTLYAVISLSTAKQRMLLRRKANRMDNAANDKACDSLLNYETVKYCCGEVHEVARYEQAVLEYLNAQTHAYHMVLRVSFFERTIFSASLLATMILSAKDVVEGDMSVGHFVMVNAYVLSVFKPLSSLSSTYKVIVRSMVDMEKMLEILQETPTVSDKPGAVPLIVTEGRVVFDHVYFSYDHTTNWVLEDISFEAPPGTTIGIVGPTGAGKSTISKLLLRFYGVDRGAIFIDGQELADATEESLRLAIGVVPQDTALFNESIGYNIWYGDVSQGSHYVLDPETNMPNDNVIKAAEFARIHDICLAMQDRYNTKVGERGVRLSGGEKQRLAIARMFLKKSPILLLDEATSSLDVNTEKKIQTTLRKVCEGRTTLIIAHRLSTIVHADLILVLKKGRIVERGTHSELISMEGLYCKMWTKQLMDIGTVDFIPDTPDSRFEEPGFS